jgi:hypothetical protein
VTYFETAERVFVVVRGRSPEYENRPRVGSSVRHRTPKFALTAVKLLSETGLAKPASRLIASLTVRLLEPAEAHPAALN